MIGGPIDVFSDSGASVAEVSMMNRYVKLAALLMDLEGELRALGWWDSESPSVDALSSTMPFAADTLEFYQWVQFIFLPRMYVIVDEQLPFPGACSIAPMLEEYSRISGRQSVRLQRLFVDIDALLSGAV
jgi:uncharacterized protein YqcC (DUF446 family)